MSKPLKPEPGAIEVPQADAPETLLALARHYHDPASWPLPSACAGVRNLVFYRHALRILGALEPNSRQLTIPALAGSPAISGAAFVQAFGASPVGQAWLLHQGAPSLADLDETSAAVFLTCATTLGPKTVRRRARTLQQWLRWSKAWLAQSAPPGSPEGPVGPLPSESRVPHNEGARKVRGVVGEDLATGDVLIVTGFASLNEVVVYLARRAEDPDGTIRIVFGTEPLDHGRGAPRQDEKPLEDEIRDYWLGRGFSVTLAAGVLRAIEAIKAGWAQIRLGPSHPPLHAKIYRGPEAVTTGSSNMSLNGLFRQHEANNRFERQHEPDRYQENVALAEWFWASGTDYGGQLISLLERLLQPVTWREALARACAEVLDGFWARAYTPARDLEELDPALWPHQLQGLAQAIWVHYNLGSVLIADAAGSGKTRLGAWFIRAIYDQQLQAGHGRTSPPVLIVPPGVVGAWQHYVAEADLSLEVHSHGLLSKAGPERQARLFKAIRRTGLLALDEAHNYVNPSARRGHLLQHGADAVALFTATPISSRASDLLSLIELLDADNFSEKACRLFERLHGLTSASLQALSPEKLAPLQTELARCMVRRTRWDLNEIAEQFPQAYQTPDGRPIRYPHYEPCFYDLPTDTADLDLAATISELCEGLLGVAWFQHRLVLSGTKKQRGQATEEGLHRLLPAAKGLARYMIFDCLQSSRIALYEHVHGTEQALKRLAPELSLGAKAASGNTIATLLQLAGHPPLARASADTTLPAWLWQPDAHREACLAEIALYEQVAELGAQLSAAREICKADLLVRLANERGSIIGFDSHLLTLQVLETLLRARGIPVDRFTGAQGKTGKDRASRELGQHRGHRAFVALCSDALSEGMNLQGAATVVHLNAPTVVRIAEQRAGRVDRMNTEHADVQIWWPENVPDFSPWDRNRLTAIHHIVDTLIGANLRLPAELQEWDELLAPQDIAQRATPDRAPVDLRDAFDAFRPVRAFLEPEGLVPPDTYRRMRTSQQRVVAAVSAVRAERPWGFFAIGGPGRIAPRWVFLDLDCDPLTDLDTVAQALQHRLNIQTGDRALDPRAMSVMRALLDRLGDRQEHLLPHKHRKALQLAKRLLRVWVRQSRDESDSAQQALCKRLTAMIKPETYDLASRDLRGVADVWLKAFRAVRNHLAADTKRRVYLRRFEDLEPVIVEAPLDFAPLQPAFERVQFLPPLAERVVAAIIGVPD